MHIPDGFLDTRTAFASGVFSIAGLWAAVRHATRHMRSRLIPMVGLTAAFVFVAQMINFPIAGGTSGHLLGATLAAILLGPSAAVIVMACVLLIQAFVFADGGALALGANILNMAIVAPICGFGAYHLLLRILRGQRGRLVAASLGAWFSTVVASLFCAGELALSGVVAWNLVLPAMAGIHSLIGIGEGVITMLVLAAIGSTRPELLSSDETRLAATERNQVILYGAIVVIALLLFVVPFASGLPDGLERVATTFGFEYRAHTELHPLLRGYSLPFGVSSGLASVLAGAVGVSIVLVLSLAVARVLVPGSGISSSPSPKK
jgi:cobalt/nickel transport system permease protein